MTRFRVQFGVNKNEYIFQRHQNSSRGKFQVLFHTKLVWVQHDYACNLVLGESKFFKNIEIAWARKANAIAIAYLHRITQGIMLLLDGIIHENALQTVKTDKILAARVLLVICTRVARNYIKNALVSCLLLSTKIQSNLSRATTTWIVLTPESFLF